MKSLLRELVQLLGPEAVIDGEAPAARPYLHDGTEIRAIAGQASAIALPRDADQVSALLAHCYAHDLPLVPRGGGTGLAGGAVPLDGAVVVSLERLNASPVIEPERWRARVQAGVITAELSRWASQDGLYYAPDPGSAQTSLIGGNIATNAGGPHTFKYGATGSWLTGLEVVLPPGELVQLGGPVRKDVAGYDLRSLLVGSEGTLGIVTAAWCKLLPAPETRLPVLGLYPDAAAGAAAIEAAMCCGVVPAAIEFLDAGALAAAAPSLAAALPALSVEIVSRTGLMLIVEADGAPDAAAADQRELLAALESVDAPLAVYAPSSGAEVRALWHWRDGVSPAVTAQRGGKVSEDIVVPVERLAEVIKATLELGARHRLPACSWGHAGDGNVHATFMIDRGDAAEVARAETAAHELFALAARAGGAVTGEHGLGLVKNGALALQWSPAALALHEQIKHVFDPKGLLNPGKKLARMR